MMISMLCMCSSQLQGHDDSVAEADDDLQEVNGEVVGKNDVVEEMEDEVVVLLRWHDGC